MVAIRHGKDKHLCRDKRISIGEFVALYGNLEKFDIVAAICIAFRIKEIF